MKRLLLVVREEHKTQASKDNSFWSCLASFICKKPEGISDCFEPDSHHNADHLREAIYLLNSHNWYNFEHKLEVEREASCHVLSSLREVQSVVDVLDDPPLGPIPRPSMPGTFWYPTSGAKDGNGSAKKGDPLARQQSPASSNEPSKLRNVDTTNLLFLRGFSGRRKLDNHVRSDAYATCLLCGEPNSIQTLLLQTSPEVNQTPLLPPPGQRSKYDYPLALGFHPELDVVLPLTCCDGCAFLLLQVDEPPGGNRAVAALPLVSLEERTNRSLWRRELARAYRHRFHDNTVLLVFLSTLCTKIEDLAKSDRRDSSLRTSLEWCKRELATLPGMPMGSSPKLVTTLPSGVDNRVPPQQVAFFACLGNKIYVRTMLTYPIDGFVVLVQLAASMNVIKPGIIQNLVWNRLLYHLTEQHMRLRTHFGLEYANGMLGKIMTGPSSSRGASEEKAHAFDGELTRDPPRMQLTSISLTSVIGTYLIPPGYSIIPRLCQLDEYFSDIYKTTKYNASLAVFLHLLASDTHHHTTAMDTLENMRRALDKLRHVEEGISNVFEDPMLVDEHRGAGFIERLDCWLGYIVW
ncbi:hypothetical protein F66182_912 [Fusarium sp. NRRL 66182]|nr:hypothetical protein F66182_912 [Fusarium sp. NRRL 66182]